MRRGAGAATAAAAAAAAAARGVDTAGKRSVARLGGRRTAVCYGAGGAVSGAAPDQRERAAARSARVGVKCGLPV